MKRTRAALIAGLLVLGLGVTAQAQMHAYGLAAKVNGVGISNQTLERNFEEYLRDQNMNLAAIRYPDRVKAMRRQVLDLLIDQELAWQAAQQTQVLATEAEVAEAVDKMRAGFKSEQAFVSKLRIEGYTEASYREHLRRLVSARKYLDQVAAAAAAVGDEAIHAFYIDNPDKFRLPEQVRARHILLKVRPGAGEAEKQAARDKLAGILEEVRAGGDFAALAQKYSEDATAARGGDLGFVLRGHTVKAFEDAAFALQAGQVSEVVETGFGYHLIKVEERRAPGIVPEAAARDQIRAYLQSVRTRQAAEAELERLRAKATIEVLLPL